MTKSDTIDAIRHLNPTADPQFLAEFSGDDLTCYLDRLARSPAERRVFGAGDVIDLYDPPDDDRDPTLQR